MKKAFHVPVLPLASCLTACIGISALLIAPALAQVNGPGPSPASSFDTVVNLPGDELLVFENVIIQGLLGGVAGQTTQLNAVSYTHLTLPTKA